MTPYLVVSGTMRRKVDAANPKDAVMAALQRGKRPKALGLIAEVTAQAGLHEGIECYVQVEPCLRTLGWWEE